MPKTHSILRKARPWGARFRQIANGVTQRLFGKSFFRLSLQEIFGDAPVWQKRLQRSWQTFWRETNFPFAIPLFAVCAALTFIWWRLDPESHLWPEMGGMAMDVLFILIFFSFFEFRRSRLQTFARQHEIIDDYKRWNDPQAQFRIAGAIRRLNRGGVYKLNLSGARMSGFSFAESGIGNICGSIFYDGKWGEPLNDRSVRLEGVEFDHVNCQNVVFSAFEPFAGLGIELSRHARFTDCSFTRADLRNSIFTGAALAWTKLPPVSHFEEIYDEESGEMGLTQVSYGPFDAADVSGAIFRGCMFTNADFRGAEGLESADFAGASGLETAIFDDGETKANVLQSVVGGSDLSPPQ